MRRTCFAIALALQLIATSIPSATAQAPIGGDIVITASGGRLRGTVSEYEPGVRVTIILPDGTSRTLAASEVASVTFADAAPAVAPVAPPTPVEPVPQVAPPTLVGPVAPPAPRVVVPGATEASVPVERWTESRAYRPLVGTPWVNAVHEISIRRPRGDIHFGVQLEGGFQIAIKDPFNNAGVLPVGGAFAFLDVTTGETGTFRVGALFDVAGETGLGYTYDHTGRIRADALFRTMGIGGRILGGHDLSDSLTLRAGIELQAVLAGGKFGFEGEGRIELAGRFLDARNLEIGGAITLGTTPNMRFQYSSTPGHIPGGFHAQGLSFPGVTLFAAWVFE